MRPVLLAGCTLMVSACGAMPPTSRGGEPTLGRVATAIESGALRFDVRGLANEATKQSYGGTTFIHKATVIAIGDTIIARRPYYVIFGVKRIEGGDPDTPRSHDDEIVVFVNNGLGQLRESGGYRLSSERWVAEKVELTPIAVLPGIPITGTIIKE